MRRSRTLDAIALDWSPFCEALSSWSHNDHDWTGSARIAELLQATGALATLGSGLAALALLSASRRWSVDGRLLLWWMAFRGLFQSLTQSRCPTGYHES
jgi:hypothetical protein